MRVFRNSGPKNSELKLFDLEVLWNSSHQDCTPKSTGIEVLKLESNILRASFYISLLGKKVRDAQNSTIFFGQQAPSLVQKYIAIISHYISHQKVSKKLQDPIASSGAVAMADEDRLNSLRRLGAASIKPGWPPQDLQTWSPANSKPSVAMLKIEVVDVACARPYRRVRRQGRDGKFDTGGGGLMVMLVATRRRQSPTQV